jgi:glutathione S-transferase
MAELPKLYGDVKSRATRCLWALYEMGVPFDHVALSHRDGETKSAGFLAINPAGKTPALVDGDLVLTESLAINLYLAQTYMTPLWPKGRNDQMHVLQWTFWAATEAEPPAVQLAIHRVIAPPERRDEAQAARALKSLQPRLEHLDRHLHGAGRYILGERFSFADINVASVLNYLRRSGVDLKPTVRLDRWLAELEARPQYKKAHGFPL